MAKAVKAAVVAETVQWWRRWLQQGDADAGSRRRRRRRSSGSVAGRRWVAKTEGCEDGPCGACGTPARSPSTPRSTQDGVNDGRAALRVS